MRELSADAAEYAESEIVPICGPPLGQQKALNGSYCGLFIFCGQRCKVAAENDAKPRATQIRPNYFLQPARLGVYCKNEAQSFVVSRIRHEESDPADQ